MAGLELPLDKADLAIKNADLSSVLIVEDEALVALDLEDMLLDLGFEDVVVCNSVAAARRTLEQQDFPFAVFDLNLDGETSVPLIADIMGQDMKIVVASGYDANSVALPDASIARIAKPYRLAELKIALFSD